jgi:hypothetical protein
MIKCVIVLTINLRVGVTLLKKKTVFVIGAGASYEYGLPVGEDLALNISEKLDVKFDDWGDKITTGDARLFHNVAHNQNYLEYQKTAWLIRDGIILANSIDDFLHIHRGNAHVVRYGTAASNISSSMRCSVYTTSRLNKPKR